MSSESLKHPNKYVVVDSSGKILEKFRQIGTAKHWANERAKEYFGEELTVKRIYEE